MPIRDVLSKTCSLSMITAAEPVSIDHVLKDLDQARKRGVLKQILIPPCPELLTRLQHVMAHAEPDLNEVARIATSDVAMSAALLRAANGPLYASGQSVQTLGQAMNRLGLAHTASVMTDFLARGALRVTSPHLTRFWERSSKRAQAMAFMADRLPGVSVDVAYTFGLFCHVGMPVMAQSLRGYMGTVAEAMARIDRSFVATENANHRTDHAVVGALVTRLWRLAPAVTVAVRLHHDLYAIGERKVDSDVHTLVSMGLLAEHLMRKHEGLDQDADWSGHGAAALDWLQVAMPDLEAWSDELQEPLDAV
jgi:HD-like signal output (HDOD) protein